MSVDTGVPYSSQYGLGSLFGGGWPFGLVNLVKVGNPQFGHSSNVNWWRWPFNGVFLASSGYGEFAGKVQDVMGKVTDHVVRLGHHATARVVPVLDKLNEHGTTAMAQVQELPLEPVTDRLSPIFWFGVLAGLVLARACVRSRHSKHDEEDTETKKQASPVDPEVEEASQRLGRDVLGAVTSSLIYVGDKLGFYKELSLTGPTTPETFASRTGFNERWVREWMMQMAAAKILAYDGNTKTFTLKKAYEKVLLSDLIGMFQFAPAISYRIAHMIEPLQTGLGQSYDDSFSEDIAFAIRTLHHEWASSIFTTKVSHHPLLKDKSGNTFASRLVRGGVHVADFGCGAGEALIEMASVFPKSTFHGFELSKTAIEMGRDALKRRNIKNARFFDCEFESMENGKYDMVICYDVIHDTTQPVQILEQIRAALKPDGFFLVVEIECFADVEANLSHPQAALRYGISCGLCLHSGCSEPGGCALGTMGLNPSKFHGMTTMAGFTRFKFFQIPQLPGNNLYVIQP